MSTWYEQGAFYHMYSLEMTGALKRNGAAEVTNRFEGSDKWISHIRSLGADIIYIDPLFESTSHGYDTRDHKLVDRRLGDNGPFRKFVDRRHQEGIRVVVSSVLNHTGRELSAFKDIQEKRWDSPYRDWYKGVNFDWQSPCGDSFGYEAWQEHFELPCPNLFNLDMRPYLSDVIRSWADEFDIDGIHLDRANVLDFNFTKEMRNQTGAMKGDFWFMGEVIHGDYSRWVDNEMLHSVINYELHKSPYSGFDDHNSFETAHNARRLEAIERQLYTFVDNHDEDRVATKLKLREHLLPIYICLSTLSGIPSIYYGGERGVEGKYINTSDEALRPAISIEQEGELHCELTDLTAQLGQIHSQQEPLHTGHYRELLLINRQYAFARHGEDSVIITTVNSDDGLAELAIPVPFQAGEAINLSEPADRLPISNGKVHIKLKDNWGAVLKLKGEN